LRPRWMTAVGVLGIVFGCFGVLSASQTLLMPIIFEWQRKIFAMMEAQAAKQPQSQAFFSGFAEILDQFLAPLPAWFTPWSVFLGLLSLVVAGAYVFGAIWLLLVKPSAPRIFCSALVASIATTIMRAIGLILARGLMGLAMGMGGAFGVVIDLVLLIVVLAHKQEWPVPLAQNNAH
jgi:hypothetical protein